MPQVQGSVGRDPQLVNQIAQDLAVIVQRLDAGAALLTRD